VVLSKCIGQVTLWGLLEVVAVMHRGQTLIKKSNMGEEGEWYVDV